MAGFFMANIINGKIIGFSESVSTLLFIFPFHQKFFQ